MSYSGESATTIAAAVAPSSDAARAKAYLLSTYGKGPTNLYDHLSSVIARILEERMASAAENLVEISKSVKKRRFVYNVDSIQDQHEKSREVLLAEQQSKLFLKQRELPEAETSTEEGALENDHPVANLLEVAYYFEQAGVGLGREEMYRVFLAIQQLAESKQIRKARFWGKLFGLEKNYYIAECDMQDDAVDEVEVGRSQTEAAATEQQQTRDATSNAREGADGDADEEGAKPGEEEEADPVPKPNWKPPPVIPTEEKGTGVNKKVYFVCNELGDDWKRLPFLTPQQILAGRQVRKLLTGRLDAEVSSYPPFPGTEANLLRAQISRITAATQISPLGFYTFEEEEEAEEDGGRTDFVEAEEFTVVPVPDLIDPTLANWVHHSLHILNQGRTTWWNPIQKREENEDEEAEEEEEEAPEEAEPETGPPLLTPLSEDSPIEGGHPAWTPRASSRFVPQHSFAVMSSNVWPGAHAYCDKRNFENVYIGWGVKYAADNFTPQILPPLMEEFPSGPEITEVEDPSPEEEAAAKAAQMKAEEEEEMQEEGEEQEEGEQDEDGDDD